MTAEERPPPAPSPNRSRPNRASLEPTTYPGCSTAVSGMISTSALRSRMERITRVGVLARLIRLVLAVLLSSLAALLLVIVSSLLGQVLVDSGSRRTTHVLKVGSRLGCDRLMLRGEECGGSSIVVRWQVQHACTCKPMQGAAQSTRPFWHHLLIGCPPEQRLASEVVCVAHTDVCGHHCSYEVALGTLGEVDGKPSSRTAQRNLPVASTRV